MASGCVSNLGAAAAKQRLQPAVQESSDQEVNLSDGSPEIKAVTRDVGDGAACAAVEQRDGEQLKKPRRKDTPVLNSPPHIPGARLLMGEKQTVYLEDEERDRKD